MKKKKSWMIAGVFLLLAGGVTFLSVTNENVATELRQVRQPIPNQFFVGIDVSATISTDILEKLKDTLIDRLKQFVGDEAVSYHVATFGNPGCAKRSFADIVSSKSPKDAVTFQVRVDEKIRDISIVKVAPRETTPLTSPLNCFLETYLPAKKGGRVIIFSDLMNDDSDCVEQYLFPEKILTAFGEDKTGQLIFLYPTPALSDNKELNQRAVEIQQEFIRKMQALAFQGKLRVFFYHIPDDPLKRRSFLQAQLENAVPATMFDVVWERASKVVQSLVSAVRG